jgi:hypothetical protein
MPRGSDSWPAPSPSVPNCAGRARAGAAVRAPANVRTHARRRRRRRRRATRAGSAGGAKPPARGPRLSCMRRLWPPPPAAISQEVELSRAQDGDRPAHVCVLARYRSAIDGIARSASMAPRPGVRQAARGGSMSPPRSARFSGQPRPLGHARFLGHAPFLGDARFLGHAGWPAGCRVATGGRSGLGRQGRHGERDGAPPVLGSRPVADMDGARRAMAAWTGAAAGPP